MTETDVPTQVRLDGGTITLEPQAALQQRLATKLADATAARTMAREALAEAQAKLSQAGAALAADRDAWEADGFRDVLLNIDRIAATLAVDSDQLAALAHPGGGITGIIKRFGNLGVGWRLEHQRSAHQLELTSAHIQLAGLAWPKTATHADQLRQGSQAATGLAGLSITQAEARESEAAAIAEEIARRQNAERTMGFDSLYTAAYLTTYGAQPVPSPLVPKAGEEAYVVVGATLSRYRTRTRYAGTSQGVSIPLGHTGIRYRVGQFHGQPIQQTSLVVIDSGTLVLTNRRVAFIGAQKSVTTNLVKILHVDQYSNGLAIFQEGRETPDYYFTNSPAYFLLYLNWSLGELNA